MADFEGYTGIYHFNISFSNDLMLIIVLAFLAFFAWISLLNFQLFNKLMGNIIAGEQRQSIFETTEKSSFFLNAFMVFQALLLISIYLISAAAKYKFITNTSIKSTFLSIGLLLILLFIYFLFKKVLYSIFGLIFIDKSTNKMLFINYQALLSAWGITLYFPVLWILLLDAPSFISVIILIFSYLSLKIFLLIRFIHIFLKKKTGFLFLSLYLCTHEIAPLVFLYQGLIFTYNFIERNYTWQ